MIGPDALTRRDLVRRCALLPLLTLPTLPGCNRAASTCVDPAQLSRGEEQMRKIREYAEISPFEHRQCANCQFFRGYEGEACGHCDILGSPVSQGGYCASWAARG